MKRYAIIDVETTGGKASRDRITEIAIVLHDGRQVLDRWSSLVNPECYIPRGITELTGITQEMVADAPKFYEIAREVVTRTEGAVFVAHNARFDYSFVREEFQRLGYTFTRKQLCTVRLSRQAFPGLPSYSLGNLSAHFGIPNHARHRALGDALATALLLERIFEAEDNQESAEAMINLGIREALLPEHLNLELIHQLPETHGVYFFHNREGEVVYVGKSINIKKRVAEHFAQKTEKAARLQRHVHDVTYQVTGNELIALLLESQEIKRLRPAINRAQRVRHFPFVIHTWVNATGYRCFGIEKTNAQSRKSLELVSEYPKMGAARSHLRSVLEAHQLCEHYCQAHPAVGSPCFNYHIKQCLGACIGSEQPERYNERAQAALEHLSTVFEEDFLILDKGRHPEERSVVLVAGGNYQGFGYIDRDVAELPQVLDAIKPVRGNPETRRIIQRYLGKKHSAQIIPLHGETFR